MHCIAWFRENLGFTVEPYGTDYHGVLCRTEDGLHFAWHEDAQRLGGSNYRKYPDGPAAVLMQRRTYFLLKGVEGHVKEGTPNARRVTQLYSLSDGMNNNRLFYDLAGLGASLEAGRGGEREVRVRPDLARRRLRGGERWPRRPQKGGPGHDLPTLRRAHPPGRVAHLAT